MNREPPSLTTAFRNHVIDELQAGEFASPSQWIRANFKTYSYPGQSESTAEASCRCACQRLHKAGWLDRNYRRTDKPAPQPWD